MASVQELLLAAESRKKPSSVAQLLSSALTGYDQGLADRSRNLDIAIKTIQKQQLESQMANERNTWDLFFKDMTRNDEMTTQSSLNEAGVKPKPVLKSDKFKKTYSLEGGRLSVKSEEMQTKEPDIPKTLEELWVEKVRKNEMTLPEALSAKTKGAKPPLGFRWTEDGNLEVIPGGPADIKLNKINEKEGMLMKGQVQKADLIISKVDQALAKIGPSSTGWGAKMFGNVPATKAKSLRSDIETIKANLGFQQLQDMRASSPTGGALGQVSDREISLLTSALASLDPELDEEKLQSNLNEVKLHYQNWKDAVQQALQGNNTVTKSTEPKANMPNNNPTSRIRVKRIIDGKTGTIDEKDYDPNKYQRVDQ